MTSHIGGSGSGETLRVCIVQPGVGAASETFLREDAQRLPGVVGVVHFNHGQSATPWLGSAPVLSQSFLFRASRKITRVILRRPSEWERERGMDAAFRTLRSNVVLAQYGPTGVAVAEACRRAHLPLVVHFHGYDASRRDVVARFARGYTRLFDQAAAVVVVSRAMGQRLSDLGLRTDNLFYNPTGVDCFKFSDASPASAPPVFVAVGRLVEKKAPHLTLAAFAQVVHQAPEARLRIIGDGPLRGVCEDLIKALGLESAVTLLGACPHDVVAQEMRQARGFVQHSVTAADGDCEGTPTAILEAGAAGLPVVSTRHAGIPEVVVHESTGLLVDERDIGGMARHWLALVRSPGLADRLGRRAAAHVRASYGMDAHIRREACILRAAAQREDMARVWTMLESEWQQLGHGHAGVRASLA